MNCSSPTYMIHCILLLLMVIIPTSKSWKRAYIQIIQNTMRQTIYWSPRYIQKQCQKAYLFPLPYRCTDECYQIIWKLHSFLELEIWDFNRIKIWCWLLTILWQTPCIGLLMIFLGLGFSICVWRTTEETWQGWEGRQGREIPAWKKFKLAVCSTLPSLPTDRAKARWIHSQRVISIGSHI